eukprot:TRINITY_DN6382_c0_g1_i1.p1 TRINITY_DN6382_c0_g1~~TRINITY_DN6382_c0_g1_i1.p1  ORF type:complete len:964 (-),score=261.68 TRINITY_DN6382_c0_g1_i1:12-2903(-)
MTSTSGKNSIRGLTNFITDVRNCPNKELEEKRVNKEMAKIRKKFKEATGIEGYDRRKYVCKILYMYMLGYEIDFGYMEAVNLLSSNKFQEKMIGYLALTILLHENHEMLPLIVQSLQNDLQSRNELHQALALTAIANIGGKEMSESLAPIVQKLLISKATKPAIKKKASLCLLRLFRKYPELITADVWAERMQLLMEENDLGLLTSATSLLNGLATDNSKGYEGATKKVVQILTKLIINREYSKDYLYYNMANPWLQVKLLRFLSKYDPPEDRSTRSKLYEILKKILSSADEAKGQTVNHKNALNAVLFEAIDLVISLDDDRDLIRQATALLGRFISAKEHSNIRYLALEALGHLATLDSETAGLVRKYQETVILALRDPDISIRKRALDLLYGMCDKNNSKTIVSELLSYLATADFLIREELVLKIAILAEKFTTQYSWYVDVILQLISLAGDFVSDDIWYRVIQIVTNHEDIQEYAARTVCQALQQQNVHESAVKVGGYILGEFGHLIAEQPGMSPREQFESLHSKFGSVSIQTRGLLLSAYAKFVNLYPELADVIRPIFRTYQTSIDTEIQQRSLEYFKLTQGSEDLMQAVWDVMPAFPERPNKLIGATNEADALRSSDRTDSRPSTAPTQQRELPREQPPPQSPPPQRAVDPLEDIFGGLSGSPTPQHTQNGSYANANPMMGAVSPGASAASATSSLDNIFGGTPAVNTTSSVPPMQPHEVTDAFKRCLMISEGVIHQDEFLQIGFKSEYSKGMGRLMLYYGNATQGPLTNFTSSVTAPPYLNVNMPPISPVIEARAQAQQLVTMSSVPSAEISNFPIINISFVSNGRPISLSFRLPVSVVKFTEPVPTQGPNFFQQWKTLGETAPLSEQVIIKSPRPVDIPWLSKLLTTGFHLHVLQGVDPNINNVVAAGSVSAGPNAVPALLRIETNAQAQMYRATVKSSSAAVTASLRDMLVMEIS